MSSIQRNSPRRDEALAGGLGRRHGADVEVCEIAHVDDIEAEARDARHLPVSRRWTSPAEPMPSAVLIYVNEWAVAEHIAAGRLIRVLEDWTPPYAGLCLYYPGHRHVPAGLRAFVAVLKEMTGHLSSPAKRERMAGAKRRPGEETSVHLASAPHPAKSNA